MLWPDVKSNHKIRSCRQPCSRVHRATGVLDTGSGAAHFPSLFLFLLFKFSDILILYNVIFIFIEIYDYYFSNCSMFLIRYVLPSRMSTAGSASNSPSAGRRNRPEVQLYIPGKTRLSKEKVILLKVVFKFSKQFFKSASKI